MHIAVNCFVMDANLKLVSFVLGIPSSKLANPYPLENKISPSLMIITAAPGPSAKS